MCIFFQFIIKYTSYRSISNSHVNIEDKIFLFVQPYTGYTMIECDSLSFS